MGDVKDGFSKAKAWYQSRAVIGIIIAGISAIISAVFPESGIDIGGAVEIVLEDGEAIAEQADLAWGNVGLIIGLLTSLWGTLKRKVGIKSIVAPK